jgi:tetratricopeptide (TPR) repeat protein
MKRALFVSLAALFVAAPASAAIVTVGQGFASDCYEAAASERSDLTALELCNSAMEEDFLTRHNRAATLINRGIILLYRGQYAEALADFDAAIEVQPDLAEAHTHRGVALVAYHDYRTAIEALTHGLSLNPEEPAKAYFNRAIAYEELGDIPNAYRDYRRAAELAPEWRPAQRELARFRVTSR